MNTLVKFYRSEPALINAIFALLVILLQHFVADYSTDIKVAIDAIVAAVAAILTRQQVTPTVKLEDKNA
jgi:branched-subunit amino acid transport protein